MPCKVTVAAVHEAERKHSDARAANDAHDVGRAPMTHDRNGALRWSRPRVVSGNKSRRRRGFWAPGGAASVSVAVLGCAASDDAKQDENR